MINTSLRCMTKNKCDTITCARGLLPVWGEMLQCFSSMRQFISQGIHRQYYIAQMEQAARCQVPRCVCVCLPPLSERIVTEMQDELMKRVSTFSWVFCTNTQPHIRVPPYTKTQSPVITEVPFTLCAYTELIHILKITITSLWISEIAKNKISCSNYTATRFRNNDYQGQSTGERMV
jgi:hypothetical protein